MILKPCIEEMQIVYAKQVPFRRNDDEVGLPASVRSLEVADFDSAPIPYFIVDRRVRHRAGCEHIEALIIQPHAPEFDIRHCLPIEIHGVKKIGLMRVSDDQNL